MISLKFVVSEMTGKMLHKVIMDGRMDWTQLYSYEFLLSHLKVK
jgi:hypothetical protein